MTFPLRRLVALEPPGAAPREIAARVTAALGAEPPAGVLLRGAPHEQPVLDVLPRDVPVVAVLPDMARLLRDASEHGLPRTALARLRRGGIGGLTRLAGTGLRHLPAIVRQDFAGLVPVLLALERAALGPVALGGVALAAPLTDLLMAASYHTCLARVLAFVQRSLGVPAGLETSNLGHLLPRLAAWGVAPDFVLGPLNARGFRTKPSLAAVCAAVEATPIAVLATEATAGRRVAPAEAEAFARRTGAAGVVVTLAEL